jgi:hypothetical protein
MSPNVSAEYFIRKLKLGSCTAGLRHDSPGMSRAAAEKIGLSRGQWLEFNRSATRLVATPGEFFAHYGSTSTVTGRHRADNQNIPKEPTMSNTERAQQIVKNAEIALAAAQSHLAEQERITALRDRFNRDHQLALATASLTTAARSLVLKDTLPQHSQAPEFFATFRKELQPLAAEYGVKIVLIGDKTTATVVLA